MVEDKWRDAVTGCEFGLSGTGSGPRLSWIDEEEIREGTDTVGKQGTDGKGREEGGCWKEPIRKWDIRVYVFQVGVNLSGQTV